MDGVCEEEVAEVVREIVEVCPWMSEEDVGMVWEVLASHFRLVAGVLLGLAERAEGLDV